MNDSEKTAHQTQISPAKRKWTLASLIISPILLITGIFLWENQKKIPATAASPTCKGTVGIEKGDCAPNFTLPTLQNGQEGKKESLSSYMGKPTILYFFYTKCRSCMNLLPVIMDLQTRYSDRIQFLFMNEFHKESIGTEEVQAILNRQRKPKSAGTPTSSSLSPVFLEDKDTSKSLYPTIGEPTTLFINAEGRVIHKQIDYKVKDDLVTPDETLFEENIEKLLLAPLPSHIKR